MATTTIEAEAYVTVFDGDQPSVKSNEDEVILSVDTVHIGFTKENAIPWLTEALRLVSAEI